LSLIGKEDRHEDEKKIKNKQRGKWRGTKIQRERREEVLQSNVWR